jgi:hypothetical protein
MNTVFGTWMRPEVVHYRPETVGSGYENVALAFDGIWRSLSREIEQPHERVLCCAPENGHLIKKSKKWRQLLILEEAGTIINGPALFERMLDAEGVDGCLIHSARLRPWYEALGKPVYEFYPPYPFERAARFARQETVPGKVCLNHSRIYASETNLAGSLQLCKLLPDFQFVSRCSGAKEAETTTRIIAKAGVKNWKCGCEIGWTGWLAEMSDCDLFASLDFRFTWGRFALDAAALGRYCLGVYSGAQALMYPPELEAGLTDVHGLAKLLRAYAGKRYKPPEEAVRKVSYEFLRKTVDALC